MVVFSGDRERWMRIIVDADACPRSALSACLRAGQKHKIAVWTVATFDHAINSDHHVVVGTDPQESDIKIMNMTQPGDLVITQDWGLAAMAIGKGARCLSPAGIQYRPDRVDFLLEERELKARYRRSGGRTKGPKKRTVEDDRRFEASLERILSELEPIPARGSLAFGGTTE
jgi:uncharacterized protein